MLLINRDAEIKSHNVLALQTQQKAGRNVEELAPHTLLTGAQKGTTASGKGLAVTYKLNNYLLYDPAFQSYLLKRNENTCLQKKICA